MKFFAGIGSRQTPDTILARMTRCAWWLHSLGYTLRSGGAPGADSAFEEGAGDDKQVFLPWKGFNGNKSKFHTVSSQAMEIAAKFHPAWDRCSDAAKKLHGRNVYQVLGPDLIEPAKFVVCWTTDGKASGGTGQAMRIAAYYEIPIFNLHDEMAPKNLYDFVMKVSEV